MNYPPNGLGRPPSYTQGRSTSPMPPGGPPPINTGYPPQGQPGGYGAPQPPQYGQYGQQQQQQMGYPARAEVEGSARSNKAQLIVGIDFGTTFSGVAFAFATNTEAKEDIITEWPGSGTQSKQKVSTVAPD